MKLTNVTPSTRELAATGQVVEPGESVEVDDVLGTSLLEQSDVWSPTPTVKPSRAKE